MAHIEARIFEIKKLIKMQVIFGLVVLVLVCIVEKNLNSLCSSLLGFVIAFSITLAYVCIAFNKGVVATPDVALKRHKQAMVARFVLNIILFALVFILYKKCNFILLILTYISTLSAYWIVLLKK